MQHHVTAPRTADDLDFRQLRHQTKNALACILAQVSSELSNSSSSRRVASEVERRVMLTASISDALFGLTRAPGPFDERLASLCEGVVELLGEDGQCIRLTCEVQCEVPAALQEPILRVAHEYVSNAVKHGMHVRLVGRIGVTVTQVGSVIILSVDDDGWGCGRAPRAGEGMNVSAALAEAAGGSVALMREESRTVATLQLPVTAR